MRFGLALPLLLIALTPHTARAVCGAPPPVRTSPPPGGAAPTNARIALAMPIDFRKGASFSLRTAPIRGSDVVVLPLAIRASSGGVTEWVELLPKTSLAPKMRYEVWTSRGEIVGVLVTDAAADTSAPAWSGLRSGRAWHPPARGGVIQVPEECGSALVSLEMARSATDDKTGAKDIRYALWAGDTIDYAAPPLGWATVDPARANVLEYGNTESQLNDIALPTKRPLKVGVRAIDLAGNATPPSELVLP